MNTATRVFAQVRSRPEKSVRQNQTHRMLTLTRRKPIPMKLNKAIPGLILLTLATAVMCSWALYARAQAARDGESSKDVIITTGDLTKPYEVVDIIMSYQEFPQMSYRQDPLVSCLNAATADLRNRARKAGASAIVSLKFDFENRTEKDEGRLLAYGTLVRFNK